MSTWASTAPRTEIVEELLDGVVRLVEQEVPWRPGARELLAELRDRDVPCALVTMSWRRFVDPVVRALPAESFDAVVCRGRGPARQAAPGALPRAAELLGSARRATVAIEDSTTGVASAEAAGCQVLVVPTTCACPRRTDGCCATPSSVSRARDLADVARLALPD